MTDESNGRVRSGLARAASLSPEQRAEIARRAAEVRWGPKLLRATHKGNFKEKFGIDVECYVLDDIEKTAVVSQTGMARALGLSPRGHVFPRFITSQAMAESVSTDLRQKTENPVK